MTKTCVLDASAILDFLEAGPGFGIVERLLKEGLQQKRTVLVASMNWGEVFYHLWQKRGEDKARHTIAALSRLPLQIVPVDVALGLKAAEVKALHKIPYVDCVAAALAESLRATLVTSDRDFEKLGRRVQILWTRRP